MLRQRKTRRTATCVALGLAIVGLIVAAYAANPDADVTISAVGNDGKHVWGKGETVSYKAQCGVCDETDNTGFSQYPFGFAVTSNYDGDSFAYVSGVKDTTGTYDLTAECPEDGGHGAPTQQFKVVDLLSLTIATSGLTAVGDHEYCCPVSSTASVPFTAALTPTSASGELRSEFMVWKKNGSVVNPGTDQLHYDLPRNVSGEFEVKCKGGPNGNELGLKINVISPSQDHELWWFDGENAANFAEEVTLKAWGLSTGTFLWTVTSGTDLVDFVNGLDTQTRYDTNEVRVVSTNASVDVNDVTIKLTYNGVDVATYSLSVYSADSCITTPGMQPYVDSAFGGGFLTIYYHKVLDAFGDALSGEVEINESFSAWTSDFGGENWGDPNPWSGMTNIYGDGMGTFRDHYSFDNVGATPPTVNPTAGGAGTKVQHATQVWKAGSWGTGAGYWFKQHTMQFYRGYGREE